MIYYSTYSSPLGDIYLVSDGQFLTQLFFADQKLPSSYTYNPNLHIFSLTIQFLDEYFQNKNPKILIPIKPSGTQFQKLVWSIVQKIDYGTTKTYRQIAEEVKLITGQTHMSAQAIGGALKHNPLLIVIPCHRVVGSHHQLVGYSGGLSLKRALLKNEQIINED